TRAPTRLGPNNSSWYTRSLPVPLQPSAFGAAPEVSPCTETTPRPVTGSTSAVAVLHTSFVGGGTASSSVTVSRKGPAAVSAIAPEPSTNRWYCPIGRRGSSTAIFVPDTAAPHQTCAPAVVSVQ